MPRRAVRWCMSPPFRLLRSRLYAAIPSTHFSTTLAQASEVEKKWESSSWGKRLAKAKARKATSDFDRFKVMIARKKKSQIVKKQLKSMK